MTFAKCLPVALTSIALTLAMPLSAEEAQQSRLPAGGSALEYCPAPGVSSHEKRAYRASSFGVVGPSSKALQAVLVADRRAGDLTDEEFARRQAEFLNTMPGAPSLGSASGTASGVQYERRSPTNVFPYSENATGLSPAGKIALYHVGVGIVGTDLVTHATADGIPRTVEYNIPHLPQEEQLWCWAAAAQQTIGWVNRGYAPTQCAIVALGHGLDIEKCCGDRRGICHRTGEIPTIERLIEGFGGYAEQMAIVPRDPKRIYDIVRGGATLLIRLRPQPHDAAVGIRHMIVVRGIEWDPLPNGKLSARLLYNDPLGSGYRSVSFESIVGFFEEALLVRRNT